MPVTRIGRSGSALNHIPLLARTTTIHRPVGPVAYDCVKFVVVRDGSAILFSEFGQRPITGGDVLWLGTNVLCGSEPEGHITVTTIYLDTDFVLDQFFWEHCGVLSDRFEAQRLAEAICSEPAQILRLGEDRTGLLMPWLDELVALSVNGRDGARFHRMQALWFAIADVVTPYIRVTPARQSPTQRARTRPTLPRDRRFAQLGAEVRTIRDALRADVAHGWTLDELAELVHLSSKQLARTFARAFGKTPQAYLTMLRVERMAFLLRTTDLPIAEIGRQAGWSSRSRAHAAFRECVGLSTRDYRKLGVPHSRSSECRQAAERSNA